MDGYAVRAEDVPAAPTTLKLVGQAPAGGSYDHALQPGETVRIFTGGPLPMGADAIVIQEDTKAEGDRRSPSSRRRASAATSARPGSTSRRATAASPRAAR